RRRKLRISILMGNTQADFSNNLYKLWNRLSSGSYFPPPVRRVEIPKANGGTRPLGIEDAIARGLLKPEESGDHYRTAQQRGRDPPLHQRLAGGGGGTSSTCRTHNAETDSPGAD